MRRVRWCSTKVHSVSEFLEDMRARSKVKISELVDCGVGVISQTMLEIRIWHPRVTLSLSLSLSLSVSLFLLLLAQSRPITSRLGGQRASSIACSLVTFPSCSTIQPYPTFIPTARTVHKSLPLRRLSVAWEFTRRTLIMNQSLMGLWLWATKPVENESEKESRQSIRRVLIALVYK